MLLNQHLWTILEKKIRNYILLNSVWTAPINFITLDLAVLSCTPNTGTSLEFLPKPT